jgi:hypothetical protein
MKGLSKKVNLVLIPDLKHDGVEDFQEISKLIRGRSSDVIPSVVSSRFFWCKKWWLLFRPTLFISTRQIRKKRHLRGLMLHGASLSKEKQYQMLQESGVSNLRWTAVEKETKLDPQEWGEFVVVKPEGGCRGRGVKVMRTRRVRWKDTMAEGERLVVQQFVHTGAEPVSYRVLTLFGEALYCMRSWNDSCGGKLEKAESPSDFAGHNIVATAREGTIDLVDDAEVIEFAAEVAAVFDAIPVLGVDVLRDMHTGELYCVEVNPFGQTWHFSSELGKLIQESTGICFAKQFGAFELAAEIFIKKARELAQ